MQTLYDCKALLPFVFTGDLIMKTLLKNAKIINVFTDSIDENNILIEDDKIIGVGNYNDNDADIIENLNGKYVCPGFIDAHMHIESTMLTPYEFSKVSLPHGTTSVIADPHEIANVCGIDGIKYMLECSENLPSHIYINLPSCVPATPFDESAANLEANDLSPLYNEKRVLGLAEMMNYPGVIFNDKNVHAKINDAKEKGKIIDGHAPLLSGKDLDKYISAGIQTDHECSVLSEAIEKLSKGQWIMIRQGTAARNLEALLPLFDEPYNHRCILATDDRHPADLMSEGHIDNIIRLAIKSGKNAITAIRMATLQAAQCYNLQFVGAIAPGYRADMLVLNDLNTIDILDVYSNGKKIVNNKLLKDIKKPIANKELTKKVLNSFNVNELDEKDFYIEPKTKKCRVIKLVKGELLTDEIIANINWDSNNGIDTNNDILKLAVIERHNNTGHIGLGFINGIGLKKGAIASSVSHDSHNLIVIGTNDKDIALAANHIRQIGGGNAIAVDGKIYADMALPIAGLMADKGANIVAQENEKVRTAVYNLGVPNDVEPFMNMAFVSLPVIPHIKMTPQGLVDVDKFARIPLYFD